MNVLITHEYSGKVRDAFALHGHNAMSCDLLPSDNGGNHYHGDCFDVIDGDYDFIGAHPPCTFITNSGARWLYNSDGSKKIERWEQLEDAVNHFNAVKSKIKTGYLENPIPHKYARDGFFSVRTGKWVDGIGKYSQIIQPWQFGHGETKATCLWLIGLPFLIPTDIVEGREQRIWKLPPSADRWKLRSQTYEGIANAMARQWGEIQMSIFHAQK